MYGHPRTVFRLFPESETGQGLKSIDLFVLYDYIVDTLFHFNLSHKDCVKQFDNFPVSVPIHHIILEVSIVL